MKTYSFFQSPFFKILRNRYVYTGLAFSLWIVFFDDASIIRQRRRTQELKSILEKKAFYQQEIASLKTRIQALDTDKKIQEEIARERFMMKKKNEDVFLFKPSQP